MGMNILILHKETEKDHPYWDYLRYGLDGDFHDLLPEENTLFFTNLYKNISNWKIKESKNRWFNFARILDNDRDYEYYISY